MKSWLEVSLQVDGELAEAAADVLARFAPNGVVTEQAVEFLDDEDRGTPSGPIIVRAYLVVDAHLEETRQKLEESLHYLGMIQPLPEPTYRKISDQNWMEAWKDHYQPIPVGESLLILPAWMESAGSDRIPIKIDPGMAFGTGTHPTTQLCLELLESILQKKSPDLDDRAALIDIGCGSGILSVAALKMGLKTALGVDIDKQAVEAAKHNAALNGIGSDLILGVGSVREIAAGAFAIARAPLVIANILAPVILRLFDEGLRELLLPGGTLVVSGILLEQAEAVLEAARGQALGLFDRRDRGDWAAMAFTGLR